MDTDNTVVEVEISKDPSHEIISKQLMNMALSFTRLSNSEIEKPSHRKINKALSNLVWAMWESYEKTGDFQQVAFANELDKR